MTTSGNVEQNMGDERISQRLINGVRVIEKETHRIIKLVGGRYVSAPAKSEPRLVLVDDQPNSFITRDRISIAGLNAILRNAVR